MITKPDAYLTSPIPARMKLLMQGGAFIDALQFRPNFPLALPVTFVDAAGDVIGEGIINGLIVTVIDVFGKAPLAVFSTGERVALELL